MYMVGHTECIECLVANDNLIVSTCLAGDIRVWDARTGETISHINRRHIGTNVDDDCKMRQQVSFCLAPHMMAIPLTFSDMTDDRLKLAIVANVKS